MSKIEILSPARNEETVKAAVRSGCDAVYVGMKKYSARMAADNFTLDELENCVKYCHQRNVKVYVAINTVIFDEEIEDALLLVRECAKRDIDAVIVQDLGFAYAIRKIYPSLALHASTQMSVFSVSGVKKLYNLGFKRVVLARELTKEEIRYIHEQCPDIELEVFVHGALCMCVSGQCYFSAMLGGRSANRGMCAQPCRLPYTGKTSECNGLSLKDNSIIDKINELAFCGVTSMKIEGRMKRPEYVAVATRACKEQRDNDEMSLLTKTQLEKVFSREGFTKGYYEGKRNKEMFGKRTKEDVTAANEALFKDIRQTYQREEQTDPLRFIFTAKANEKAELKCNGYTVYSEKLVEKAKNKATDEERIKNSLNKTKDTHYFVEDISLDIDKDIAISVSEINSMRREMLSLLDSQKETWHEYTEKISIEEFLAKKIETTKDSAKKTFVVSKDTKINNSFKKFDVVFIDIFSLNEDAVKKFTGEGVHIGLDIPRTFISEQKIKELLQKYIKLGIRDIYIENISMLELLKGEDVIIYAGFTLNICNSYSLLFLKEEGVSFCEASIELTQGQIRNMKKSIPVGMTGYSYIPLMISRNCPFKTDEMTCKSCKKDNVLQDRKDKEFRVFCKNGVVEILNCVPLILPQKIYEGSEAQFTVFHFFVENSVENKEKIISKMALNSHFDIYTTGMYRRGVK